MRFLISRSFLMIACGGLALTTIVGCGKKSSDGAAGSPLSQRSFVEPTLSAVENGNKMEAKTLSATNMNSLFRCEEPATAIRIAPKAHTVTYDFSSRQKSDVELGAVVVAEKVTYSTETEGTLYSINRKLLELSYGGQTAVIGTPYDHTDNCSLENGCDTKKRVFTAGNGWEKAQSVAQLNRMEKVARDNEKRFSCSFSADPDGEKPKVTLRKFKVTVFGEERDAVEFLREEIVEIDCNNEYIGTGSRTSRSIVLADRLPQATEFSTSSIGSLDIGCVRTKVFTGQQVLFDGEVFEGSANEVLAYDATGEIKSIADWEKEADSYQKTKVALERAVAVAQARVNEAKSNLSRAESVVAKQTTNYKVAEEEVLTAQNNLERIKNDPDATEDEIAAAETELTAKKLELDKAQSSLASARDEREAAARAVEASKTALADAEKTLSDFLQANPAEV